jgi:hypothetical protein
MQEGTVFTRISDLGLCFAHRTLLLPSIQQICHESRPREIGESPLTRSFGVTGPVSRVKSREAGNIGNWLTTHRKAEKRTRAI